MFARIFFGAWFCLMGSSAVAADAQTPAAGSKAEEFVKISKEWNDLIANLGAWKAEYATSTDAARRADLAKQFNEGRAQAEKMLGKLTDVAKDAFLEAPNSNPDVTKVLVGMLFDDVNRDDYEKAFDLGKLMMDHKCNEKRVPALAGIAAYCVNRYDLAEPWLKSAEASGVLAQVNNEMPVHHGPPSYVQFPQLIDYMKTAWAKEKRIREAEAKADDLPRVLLKTTAGDIELELFENEAPNTVLNFITLVDKGFYKDVKFHRVLPGFMAQGGDPKGDGTGGPGYTIPCECPRPDHRLHFRGSLSMAKKQEPDTGGSQFFITFVPTLTLDGKHTVFGRVIKGMDVLAKIKRRNPEDSTVGPADTIIEAKVLRRRNHPYDPKDLKKSGNTD